MVAMMQQLLLVAILANLLYFVSTERALSYSNAGASAGSISSGSSSISSSVLTRRRVNTTAALVKFQQGNIDLTLSFLKQMLDKRPGQNFMFSGLSVLIALAQLTLNAFGKSREQLLRLQNLSKKEIRAVYPVFLNNIKEQENVVFNVANKIYGNDINQFTEKFKKQGKKVFNSSAENIDFSKNVQAAATINEWASYNTNGLIKEIVKPDFFNANTRVAIFNALYFFGNWINQFNVKETKARDFYLNENDKISLPTMYQLNSFPYGESNKLDCQVLRLPYKGNFSLLIYLPNKRTGLKNLVTKLVEPNAFSDSLKLLTNQKVKTYIPKMDFRTDFDDLKQYLIQDNVTALFTPSNDFKGIFEKEEPLLITEAVQKAALKVDEKGTEAAVVTGIIAGVTSIQNPQPIYKFELNRPSAMILILDKNPIFCGVFSGAQ